ncbi:MAG: FCD domain-containing protein [Chloroflexi bacterium]|nr:FCD domain-containing protein [Chloroflexota bacterium]
MVWRHHITDSLGERFAAGRGITMRRPGASAQSLAEHRAILAAVEAGDSRGAHDAMRVHILQFQDDLRQGLPALSGHRSGDTAAAGG